MKQTVAGMMLGVVLQSIHSVSGPQYEGLLRRARLARYILTPPARDDPAACSVEELGALYRTVYEMLGPTLSRLFHRNCGMVFAGMARGMAAWPQMVAQARAVPEAQRLGWFVHAMAKLSEGSWTHYIITEDAQAWYLALEQCHTCQDIQGATDAAVRYGRSNLQRTGKASARLAGARDRGGLPRHGGPLLHLRLRQDRPPPGRRDVMCRGSRGEVQGGAAIAAPLCFACMALAKSVGTGRPQDVILSAAKDLVGGQRCSGQDRDRR